MNNSKKTRTTALYIRVSTDAQYEEGYSVDAQKQKLEQYCKLKDITNYEFFIDGGWSGSNIERPEMKKLISRITQGEISAVVVYKLDRLSRSQKDTVFLLEDVFIPNNCNFISLNENFDTTTPYGKAMIGILSVFAQLERENIRERTRMGMYERVKSGLWMGGGRLPFGYDYDEKRNVLVPNEHAAEVKQIFELYLQGYSTCELNKMFPETANDSHIRNILMRQTYIGKIEYNGELFDSLHEPIISEDLFDKVQTEIKRRSTKSIVKSEYLLAGFVYCGKCGAKMRYQKWGKRIVIYCYSQQTSKKNLIKNPNCDNKKINAFELERVVITDLFDKISSLSKGEISQKTTTTTGAKSLKKQYEILSQKIKKLYNLYVESDDKDELLLETINENKANLAIIAKQIESEEKSVSHTKELSEKQNSLLTAKERWETMSTREKRQVLKLCIDKIIVDDDSVEISYLF